MESCVAAATKRRDEKLKAVQEREVLLIQATQAVIEEEARKRLEVLQAQEEPERAEREEAARLETERVLAGEDAIRANAMKQQQAEDQRLASEQAEKDKSETAEAAEEAQIISDPRIDNLEKSVEEIKADQKEFKEALKQQADSQIETKSILAMILEQLRTSKS